MRAGLQQEHAQRVVAQLFALAVRERDEVHRVVVIDHHDASQLLLAHTRNVLALVALVALVALRAAKHLGSVVLRAGLLRRQQDGEQRDWDARGRRECEAQRGLERQKHHVTVAPIDYA